MGRKLHPTSAYIMVIYNHIQISWAQENTYIDVPDSQEQDTQREELCIM